MSDGKKEACGKADGKEHDKLSDVLALVTAEMAYKATDNKRMVLKAKESLDRAGPEAMTAFMIGLALEQRGKGVDRSEAVQCIADLDNLLCGLRAELQLAAAKYEEEERRKEAEEEYRIVGRGRWTTTRSRSARPQPPYRPPGTPPSRPS